ncbi:MAG: hypothetical protein ACRC6N_08045 [Plesiomonas sp.]|uniref:EcpB family pilus assembly chaperone n=1 Tax=Plesiomonas sp. TaxID=2486279 RepID=UPI003F2B0D15
MKHRYFYALLPLLMSSYSYAFYMDDVTVEIPSKSERTTQKISNVDDHAAHLMAVKVEPIKSPFTMEPLTQENSSLSDITFSPARAVVAPKKDVVVKFFYHGPKDNQERYYRIIWNDEVLVPGEHHSAGMGAQVATSTILSTILVVNPRQEIFDYSLGNNIVVNKGNTAFRYVAFGACKKGVVPPKDGICREDRRIMPHTERPLKYVDINAPSSHVGIWHAGTYDSAK